MSLLAESQKANYLVGTSPVSASIRSCSVSLFLAPLIGTQGWPLSYQRARKASAHHQHRIHLATFSRLLVGLIPNGLLFLRLSSSLHFNSTFS